MSAISELAAELRAQTQLLEELHAAQLEQLQAFASIRTEFDESLSTMTHGVGAVLAALQAVADRLPEEPAA